MIHGNIFAISYLLIIAEESDSFLDTECKHVASQLYTLWCLNATPYN